jgi:iduronate 2-sulfatase
MVTKLRYGAGVMCEALPVPDDAYYDGRVAAEAVRVLDEVKGGPFFLAVGFWKPHAPFRAPKKYWEMYQRSDFETFNGSRPENAPEIAFHKSTEILGKSVSAEELPLEQASEMRHGYFANVSFLDAQIGKVLEALDASGVAQRTTIVFVSDHGYHLGEHTLWGKTSNFELDARVPCLISAAGMKTGHSRTKSLSELVDLFPTLVDLCQLPHPTGLEGKSLVPVLEKPELALKPAAFTQHPRPAYFDREPGKVPKAMGVSVRTASVRYTEWRDWISGDVVASELYSLSEDPRETVNKVNAPEVATRQREAAALLRKQFPPQAHR